MLEENMNLLNQYPKKNERGVYPEREFHKQQDVLKDSPRYQNEVTILYAEGILRIVPILQYRQSSKGRTGC